MLKADNTSALYSGNNIFPTDQSNWQIINSCILLHSNNSFWIVFCIIIVSKLVGLLDRFLNLPDMFDEILICKYECT